ncbi:helix-turn-helix transcriptional regulator [Kocuria tytonis]|uniref:XRE family transcriptional regulator n=1 Tax=Kocuria tytonis TaxID=2054280 RepID=A0A495A2S9_9MICC|nr:helix-turn-helix transcriptional regulator [Kocuria tytonis]RKQ33729.1 XRE family transcriptional regulator [Kocuria tytonis]
MQRIAEPGEAIRRARREAGLTQKDLSGVSERTARAIETGRGNPTVAALVATAGVLGLRVSVA